MIIHRPVHLADLLHTAKTLYDLGATHKNQAVASDFEQGTWREWTWKEDFSRSV